MTTILPYVFFSALPIGAGVIWLVMRNVMRDERQRMERRREAWRAGGSVGPEPGYSKYSRGGGCGGGAGCGGGGCGGGGCGGGGN